MSNLEKALSHERKTWAEKAYAELIGDEHVWPLNYECEVEGFRYNAEIDRLEKTDEYVHLGICVDDGGISAFMPLSGGIIVYANGRVDM